MTYPVPGGKIIGRPYQGSHSPGAGGVSANWQSDNAVDIAVPVGTPVYAVSSGVIGPNIGPFSSSNPALAGQRLTVQMKNGQAAYYAHLSRLAVHAGQRVSAGELLGYSGSANGVAHLHFAVERGSPLSFVAGLPAKIAAGAGLGPSETTGGPALDPSAAGCATSLLALILAIGAFFAMAYGTGVTLWP